MQSFFLLLAAALGASAAVAPHAPLVINTPCAVPLSHSLALVLDAFYAEPVQCEPLLITWSGGIRASPCSLVARIPYVFYIWICSPLRYGVSTVQTNPIQPLPISGTDVTTDTSFTWIVNATLGQSLVLLVTDEENGSLHTVSSAPFTVIPGAGDGCINGN
ncbi:hypothetical protein B0H19DRAFT_1266734 [Mycena capillaripes]|nr:hypothetical protein B0H19DRAFT_1266734 [Mycena capillaripes]